MWISKLQLSNIKSYGPDGTVIHFRPGVNLIQGRNGAGKSTILEAIGLALFGSRLYTLDQFVREGNRRGQIMVGFISGLDEREYEVVRGVGSGGRTFVHDPEVGQRVCEGLEDTSAFIRQHLRVDQESDLASLFRDAVGVPQGTLTAIFQEKASVRKEKFNRLLRVDEYERAWEALRDTRTYIQGLAEEIENRKAELRGQLLNYPDLVKEVEALSQQVAEEEAAVQQKSAEIESLAASLNVFEGIKKQIGELDTRHKEQEAAINLTVTRLNSAVERYEEAEDAQHIIQDTESAFLAYEQAQAELKNLDELRQEQEGVNQDYHNVETNLSLCEQALSQVETELAAVRAAEDEMAALEPQVGQQKTLQQELEQAKADQETYGRLQGELSRQTVALHNQLERMAGFEKDLEQQGFSEELNESSQDVPVETLQELADSSLEVIGQFELAVGRWLDVQADLANANQDKNELQAAIAEREKVQTSLQEITQTLSSTQTEENRIQAQLAQLATEQARLDEYEQVLNESDALCPVCQRPMDSHARDASEKHFADEKQRLQQTVSQLSADLETYEQEITRLQQEKAALDVQLGKLPGANALASLEERLAAITAMHEERTGAVVEVGGQARQRLAQWQEMVQALELQVESYQESGDRVAQAQQKLDELGDPLQAYELAKRKAEARDGLVHRQTELAAEQESLQEKLAALKEALSAYGDLNARFAAARDMRDQHQEEHQRYLSFRDIAADLERRAQAVTDLETERQQLETVLQEISEARDVLAKDYDPAQHEEVSAALTSGKLALAGLEARWQEHQQTLGEKQDRLAELEEAQRSLAACEAEAKKLETRHQAFDFVRGSIRQAGPAITQQLVRSIADQANLMFAEIIGDHTMTLNWSEDYAISVVYKSEVRDFELLSGGEQMAAAMAIRLALLTQLANVEFAFFDEPTTNLDQSRRGQLAESLAQIHSLKQLFIISHDDTFEQESYHVVQVHKENGLSRVETL